MSALADEQRATSDVPSQLGAAQAGEDSTGVASLRPLDQSEALEHLFRNCRAATDRRAPRASSIVGALVVLALVLAVFLWWRLLA